MTNIKTFIIFITIVLLVYISINFYLYKRAMQSAAPVEGWIWVLRIVILCGVLSYPLGRILGVGNAAGNFFIWIGSFWLALLTYGVMIALMVDIVRFTDLLTGWLPDWIISNRLLAGRMLFTASLVLIVMLLTGGHIRSLYPLTPEYEIELESLPADHNEYRIVMLSDVHLGVIVGEKRLRRIVEQVNDLSPDVILIAGDLLDESFENIPWVAQALSGFEAGDGVFAVTGNHEFYGGVLGFEEIMKEAGIKPLRNESFIIDNSVMLIGLDDQTGGRQFKVKQIHISELVPEENQLPVILIHHTPSRIKEAAEAGVDLMLSGHVHEGQLWPVKYIAEAVYGVKTGLTKVDRMYFYLSSGVGTWGPPVRIGAAPEIVTLVLKKSA
ncbi:metallophosphoesterase [bacterium]|nr:metallophosphoesterase [bacterium]